MQTLFSILFFVSISFASNANPSKEWITCKIPQDCILAPADFCGCGGMGANTAISKNKLKDWNNKLRKESEGWGCLSAMSKDWTCTKKVKADCLKNECVLVEER